MAEAGDNLDNSNFTHGTATGAIKRLLKMVEFTKEFNEKLEKQDALRTGEYNFRDHTFEAQMDEALDNVTQAYEQMNFREALVNGIYMLKTEADRYVFGTRTVGGPHRDLIARLLEVKT